MNLLMQIDNDQRIVAKYLEVAKKMVPYYKNTNLSVPMDLVTEYEKCLHSYRIYIDSLGFKMIDPIYPLDKEDDSTWLYKSCQILPRGNGYKVTWTYNEDCPYYEKYMKDHYLL